DLGGLTVLSIELETFEVVAQDIVDHPADRIGAVNGGAAALHDFDPAQQSRGNDVRVHHAVVGLALQSARDAKAAGGADESPAVHQRESSAGAQAEQRRVLFAAAAAV